MVRASFLCFLSITRFFQFYFIQKSLFFSFCGIFRLFFRTHVRPCVQVATPLHKDPRDIARWVNVPYTSTAQPYGNANVHRKKWPCISVVVPRCFEVYNCSRSSHSADYAPPLCQTLCNLCCFDIMFINDIVTDKEMEHYIKSIL